jgi:membrane protease subunit HflK
MRNVTPFETDRVGRVIAIAGGALVLLVAGWTSVYQVEAESKAVVLRFGAHIKTLDPGLHFKLPFFIDRVLHVPVLRQMKQEFGFGTRSVANQWQSTDDREQDQERSMVTGDLNAALVEWVIQYRIESPEDYVFEVRDPNATLRDASESVMREVVGDRTVDEVITIGRQDIEASALAKLRVLVGDYKMGLYIDQVQLKNVNPPRQVQESFNEVNQAQQEKENLINLANGEYNKAVPRARGQAAQKISAAEGYAKKRVNEAEGDVAAFNAQLYEYVKAPDVTRQRLYLETLSEVLPLVGRKIVMDGAAGTGVLPLLNLGNYSGRQNELQNGGQEPRSSNLDQKEGAK